MLQERRALRKLFGPPNLADHPLKPSLLCARRVPISPKVITQKKNVSRLPTVPSHKQVPGGPFKKPFYVGHGSILPCRGNGSVAEPFCAAARVKRNPNVNVRSKHTGKSDAAQARLTKALACCTLQQKTGEKHLMTGNCRMRKHTDEEKETNPAQQNCDSPSIFEGDKGGLMSNEFNMQPSYNVKSNEYDGESHVILQGKVSIWHDQLLPCSENTCADVDTCKFALHSNANLWEIDRSRNVQSPDNHAITHCFCGDVDDCTSASQTHARLWEFDDTDKSLDAFERPRMLCNFDRCSSYVFNGIFTPQSRASFQDFDSDYSSGNAGQKLRIDDDAILDNACKFASHLHARLQESDNAQSSKNLGEEPRSCDNEPIFLPRSRGNGAIFDRPCVGDDACKFVSQVNASLQESDETGSKKPRSHCNQAIFESPWGDVYACEYESPSCADYQEIDCSNDGNAGVDKFEQHSIQKRLGTQVALSDIDNEVKGSKDTKLSNTLQEKLTLFEGTVSHIAANLKKTSDQLNAKIYDNVVLLSCIQRKLSSVEGVVTKMEAFNCKELKGLAVTKSA